MGKLISQVHIDKKMSQKDYKIVKEILKKNDLSRYKLKRKDIYIVKNNQDEIIACGRIFDIGDGTLELGSLRVGPAHRGQKIGLTLCQKLIQDKTGTAHIFLATKRGLENYYKKLGFKIVSRNIPEKLCYTQKRAQEQGYDCVVMRLGK